MIEFIQNKKRLTQIPKKYALQVVGKQSRGEWNLGGGICISSSGTLMDELECENIWISDVHVGSGFRTMQNSTSTFDKHSFSTFENPAILCIASTGMYQQFIQKMRYCPIPVALALARPLHWNQHCPC